MHTGHTHTRFTDVVHSLTGHIYATSRLLEPSPLAPTILQLHCVEGLDLLSQEFLCSFPVRVSVELPSTHVQETLTSFAEFSSPSLRGYRPAVSNASQSFSPG